MDLKFSSAAASPEEKAALDGIGLHGRTSDDDARPQRDQLLPALHAVNDAIGWISAGAVNEIGRRLQVAPAEVFGVASFYDLFAFEPRPAHRTLVCVDLACRIALGGDVPVAPGQDASPCLGLCERAPATLELGAGAALPEGPAASVPQRGDPSLVMLRRVGVVDPGSLEDYRAQGGGEALRRAVELGPAGVIAELEASKLAGRGGAAFPAGRKWAAVAAQPVRPHELVANADESEPGTFKDRVLLEGDPFSVIEAMTIAGYAVGAEHGHLYLRGEYPRALAAMQRALEVARTAGLLGGDVGGHGFAFDLEVRRGAGAYICGEETAIFNSIEGYRGEPRNKPPFPVEVGLYGRPTLVNNIETLVGVLAVLTQGGAAYAAIGTDGSSGTKLFALSGAVARPGVYEVPFGVTLAELIELAGGVAPGRTLQAVLLGGAAGALVGPGQLDVALTFEGTRAAGATLGSGVVMVLDERVDVPAFLVRVAAFFRHESCGQCVPCRVGTVRQLEILQRLAAGGGGGPASGDDLLLLDDVAAVLKDASICGLGQLAANAVESARVNLGVFGVTDQRSIKVSIDGVEVEVEDGETLLAACRTEGVDVPTLCWGDTLTPKNACRVCVVELEGSRTLVPSCSRRAEDGMVVRTDTERVRRARRMVLEFLASSVDLSTAPDVAGWLRDYGAEPDRYGADAATVAQPAKVDNDLYVRDYGKCILCYKCVDACGEQWQNTFAIAVAGRGFDSRISTEFDAPLPESACVYCGNCVEVCPTGALMFRSEYELRAVAEWDEDRQTRTDTICPYCGVGCTLTLHVQDNTIVKVTSPHDQPVTSGNLCIKGRFGFQHVQNR